MIYKLFTDGACRPSRGNGGWAFILRKENGNNNAKDIVKSGFQKDTTNNRMELTALLEGLKHFLTHEYHKQNNNTILLVYSDSTYVVKGINEWINNWKNNGWKTKNNKTVSNLDIWLEINQIKEKINIKGKFVKGHSGHPENAKCDKLAVREIKQNVKT